MATPLQQSKGGFECDFVEKPPKAVQAECTVCLQILCEPYQVTCCGYSFCKTCIEPIKADKKIICPICNEENVTIFPNKGLQRSLYEFRVYCTHKQQGCEWTGELGQLKKHLTSSEIECQLCHELVEHCALTIHQADLCPKRPFSCVYCHNYQSDYDNVIHNHWPVCGFHPVKCPMKCSDSFHTLRQNLQTHITNECPLTTIDCTFHQVGCDVKLPRKGMPTHLKENEGTHTLLLASQAELTQKLKTENQLLKTENVKLKKEVQAFLSARFIVSNFEKHKKSNDPEFSTPFYTHCRGYKMRLRVNGNGCGEYKGIHVSVFINLMRGEFDDDLKWPFRGDITIQLIDQEGDEDHHSKIIPFTDKTSDMTWKSRCQDNRLWSSVTRKAWNAMGMRRMSGIF